MTPKTKRPARPRSARSTRQSQVTATQTVVQTPNSTQTVVIINQAQSLHIVQTTVSAALSAMLWINDLFPNHYFETRRYSLDDPAFSYTLKHPPQTARDKKQQANDAASVTWDFLLKGKTAKADKIWLWLVRPHSLHNSPFTLLTRYRTESTTLSSINIWHLFRSASTTATCPPTP